MNFEKDMTPDELQKWCDSHPDYPAYKEEVKNRFKELGLNYEEESKKAHNFLKNLLGEN